MPYAPQLLLPALLLTATCAGGAAVQTTVEDFEGCGNEGLWTWLGPGEGVPPAGGNPGAYLHSGLLDTFAPRARSPIGSSSAFQEA